MCTDQNPPLKYRSGLQRDQLRANISHPYITGQKLKPGQQRPADTDGQQENDTADSESSGEQ